MYALLGDVFFTAPAGFSSIVDEYRAVFAQHAVLAGKPHLQALGSELNTLSFTLRLHWMLGDVDYAYKQLLQSAEAQEPVALVYGSGRFVGWFVIMSVNSDTKMQDDNGRTAARDVSVSLLEVTGIPAPSLPTPGILSGLVPMFAATQLPSLSLTGIAQLVNNAVSTYHRVMSFIYEVRDLLVDVGLLSDGIDDLASNAGFAAASLEVDIVASDDLKNLPGGERLLAYSSDAAASLTTFAAVVFDDIDQAAAAITDATEQMEAAAESVALLTAHNSLRKDP